jgi:F-box and WD-40 domain protein CDC4
MKMDVDQADVDAMDQNLEAIPSESETIDDSPDRGDGNSERSGFSDSESMDRDEGVEAFIWVPSTSTSRPTASHHNRHRVVLAGEPMKRGSGVIPSSDLPRAPPLPLNDISLHCTFHYYHKLLSIAHSISGHWWNQ